jgi:hypothetical protein
MGDLNLQYVNRKSANELSSECPQCGGSPHPDGVDPDRFIILLNSKTTGGLFAYCRRCGFKWWPGKGEKRELSQDEIDRWKREAKERADAERLAAEERYQSAIEMLRREKMWEKYHESLCEESRELWRKCGVTDDYQNYWQLGYCDKFHYWTPQGEWVTPSMTIPIFGQDWEALNVRHRLLAPQNPRDKYRPDRAGLQDAEHPAPFMCDPYSGYSNERVIVCEGEKKAMVLYQLLDDPTLQILGIVGMNNLSAALIKKLENKNTWLWMDPDVPVKMQEESAHSLKARLIRFPAKVDDSILAGDVNRQDVKFLLAKARIYV